MFPISLSEGCPNLQFHQQGKGFLATASASRNLQLLSCKVKYLTKELLNIH